MIDPAIFDITYLVQVQWVVSTYHDFLDLFGKAPFSWAIWASRESAAEVALQSHDLIFAQKVVEFVRANHLHHLAERALMSHGRNGLDKKDS